MDNAARIFSKLVARGIPEHIARGFVGNGVVESRLDSGINEIAPLVPGSRGGFGLFQWTGPRRRQLEAFAAERGRPVSDEDMQLDFLMTELQGPERRAWEAIQQASDVSGAARLISERFLRPGIPHLEQRIAAAQGVGGAPVDMPQNALAAPQMQPQQEQANALSREEMIQRAFPMQFNQLDPEIFMNRRRYGA